AAVGAGESRCRNRLEVVLAAVDVGDAQRAAGGLERGGAVAVLGHRAGGRATDGGAVVGAVARRGEHTGRRILAHLPGGCAARRPFCARWASKYPSVVKGTQATESSEWARLWEIGMATRSAARATMGPASQCRATIKPAGLRRRCRRS